MQKFWANSLVFSPVILAAFVLGTVLPSFASQAPASEQTIGQVTSVSQLSDVQPSDWAFQALQSLVERYGCIEGYPDKTFKGNRSMTRYEFAAGLNACLERVQEIIASNTADLAKKEDLETLQKLQADFAGELETMRGRVDALEARTNALEAQQFSTTTKLRGEVIFGLASAFGSDRALNTDQINSGASRTKLDENITFSDRVRLNLDTSFTGKDRLRVRLEAKNTIANAGVTGTNMTRLGFDGDDSNKVSAAVVSYRFPLSKNTLVHVGAAGLEYVDEVPTNSQNFDSSGSGALSRFGRYNPIYRAAQDTGVIVNHKLNDALTLTAGYMVPSKTASNPAGSNGLLSGDYSALGQLTYQANPNLALGLTYVNAYYSGGSGVTGSTGTGFANNPFNGARTSVNAYSASANYRVSRGLTLSGWAGYTNARAEDNTKYKADIWNWAVQLGFPDLGKKGNFGGIVFGLPPRVTSNTMAAGREDRDASYHLEAFYKYKVNNNLAITPGVIAIFNPEGHSANPTSYVGVVRTTFSF